MTITKLLYGENRDEILNSRGLDAAKWLSGIDLRYGLKLDSAMVINAERWRRSCVRALRAGKNDPHFDKAFRDVIHLARKRHSMKEGKRRTAHERQK